MEVHHHPHAVKGFKGYFLEFIMIFLAVTMGFFAESYREHSNDRGKEKKYMQSMVADLETDTQNIKMAIHDNLGQIKGMDTLAELINNNEFTDAEQDHLYNLNERCALSLTVVPLNDMTMRQLLSSGNMRLIREQKVADLIMGYYGSGKDGYDGQMNMFGENMQKIFFSSEDIFSFRYPGLKLNKDTTFSLDLNITNFKLLTRDKTILAKYSNQVLAARALSATYINVLHDMRKRADDLLIFLEKEYRL